VAGDLRLVSDTWDPDQYSRFKKERSAPFFDLLGLVRPMPNGLVVDLGCGTGELTVTAHERLGARQTVGIDSSPAMLARAARLGAAGISFAEGDIASFASAEPLDAIISNAALHWVPDHPTVLARWTAALGERGQLAVQVPANLDHPAHVIAGEVAEEEPFLSAFGGNPPPDTVRSVLNPEDYAVILDELGFAEQHVRLQIYGHRLASTTEVVEWVRGTALTRFASRLPHALFNEYLDRYRTRLVQTLGVQEPYFYPFKRILFWGARLGA
jgi:trans-aconitate 2-methyltransferase